jgi:tryptophan 2,3-dioxygenase
MPDRKRAFFIGRAGAVGATLSVLCATALLPQQAFADAPSVADFGQSAAEQAWAATVSAQPKRAAFVTLYPDGRSSIEVRQIGDDTLNAFATEWTCWRMDHGLTWFAEMPVYVKEILPPPAVYGESSV